MKSASIVPSLFVAALASIVGVGSLSAATPKQRRAQPAHVQTTDISRRIDVNQLNMFITNVGSFAFNRALTDAGLFYPRGTDKSAVPMRAVNSSCWQAGASAVNSPDGVA